MVHIVTVTNVLFINNCIGNHYKKNAWAKNKQTKTYKQTSN